MVQIQPVKSVWSTLHKVLLQTVGNKQRETELRALCLGEEEEENGAAKRTQEGFSVNFPKRFPARPLHTPPALPTYRCSFILILPQPCKCLNFNGNLK